MLFVEYTEQTMLFVEYTEQAMLFVENTEQTMLFVEYTEQTMSLSGKKLHIMVAKCKLHIVHCTNSTPNYY